MHLMWLTKKPVLPAPCGQRYATYLKVMDKLWITLEALSTSLTTTFKHSDHTPPLRDSANANLSNDNKIYHYLSNIEDFV